jgi:DNA polymerase
MSIIEIKDAAAAAVATKWYIACFVRERHSETDIAENDIMGNAGVVLLVEPESPSSTRRRMRRSGSIRRHRARASRFHSEFFDMAVRPNSGQRKQQNLPRAQSVTALRRAARRCRACPLWKPATQTVFGAGPDDAKIMLIGEQAGDREDLEGLPFIGPAGRLLDQALEQVGIKRDKLYVTNVIKHFKFELRGKRRLHKRANAAEIDACLRWLHGELDSIAPRYVMCLGAMAARVMLGSKFRLMRERGEWRRLGERQWCLATVHPSAVLRARMTGSYDKAYEGFVADLAQLKRLPA